MPGKIGRKGGRRPSRVTRSALVGDLPRLHTGASEDGPLLQIARLALTVAAPGRSGGPRGRLARRRRRGTECLRAASGAQARNVSREGPAGDRRELRRVRVSVILARRLTGAVASQGTMSVNHLGRVKDHPRPIRQGSSGARHATDDRH